MLDELSRIHADNFETNPLSSLARSRLARRPLIQRRAVTLDTWHTAPGTQLPHFMEKAIRENDFVLIICTPRYKQRSDSRIGGAGYEGDIMTAEVLTKGNHQKFIPILRIGNWQDAAPVWLVGKYYVDLRGEPFRASQYEDLLTTLHDSREEAPPVGSIPAAIQALKRRDSRPISETKSAGLYQD
jgi:TIR domain